MESFLKTILKLTIVATITSIQRSIKVLININSLFVSLNDTTDIEIQNLNRKFNTHASTTIIETEKSIKN